MHLDGAPSVDVTVGQTVAVAKARLVAACVSQGPRHLVALVQRLKRWARARGVYGEAHGFLGGYSFSLLVICWLQTRGLLPVLAPRPPLPPWSTAGDDHGERPSHGRQTGPIAGPGAGPDRFATDDLDECTLATELRRFAQFLLAWDWQAPATLYERPQPKAQAATPNAAH